MITEDYVSFEVAKLLKEKGFREITNRYYNAQYDQIRTVSDTFMMDWNDEEHMRSITMPDSVSIPTLQMAMKWLREVHEIYIEIPIYSIGKPVLYRWNAFKNGRLVTDEEKPKTSNVIIKGDDNNPTVYYYKYEEACEVAIKYCLENLI
jgi:hypothetical protein